MVQTFICHVYITYYICIFTLIIPVLYVDNFLSQMISLQKKLHYLQLFTIIANH